MGVIGTFEPPISPLGEFAMGGSKSLRTQLRLKSPTTSKTYLFSHPLLRIVKENVDGMKLQASQSLNRTPLLPLLEWRSKCLLKTLVTSKESYTGVNTLLTVAKIGGTKRIASSDGCVSRIPDQQTTSKCVLVAPTALGKAKLPL